MASAVELLRWERRRKLAVREAFSNGLRLAAAGGGTEVVAFYLACGDYLLQGQRRLIDQDRRLVTALRPGVAAAQAEDHLAMDALLLRLQRGDDALADFANALADLRSGGRSAQAGFEAAAARFIDVLVNVLAARSHSLRHLTSTLLNDADWQMIADQTPEFLAMESQQFEAVSRLAPAGVALDRSAGSSAGG